MTAPRQAPWSGPQRVGSGLRPQTWPGWLVTALIVAVIIVAAVWLR